MYSTINNEYLVSSIHVKKKKEPKFLFIFYQSLILLKDTINMINISFISIWTNFLL